jgi:hypothetical protein
MSQPQTCYATLAKYNSHEKGTIHASPMVVAKSHQGITLMPVWGGIGYDTFSHQQGDNRCGGYFTITGAYPSYNKSCGTRMARACAGTVLRK